MSCKTDLIADFIARCVRALAFNALVLVVTCAALNLTGCAFETGNGVTRLSLLQSKTSTEFVDADGSNFTSTLDLAAFSKLEGDEAAMSYRWAMGEGEIGVGRNVQGLDNTNQAAVASGIAEAVARGAVQAFLGRLAILGGSGDGSSDSDSNHGGSDGVVLDHEGNPIDPIYGPNQ